MGYIPNGGHGVSLSLPLPSSNSNYKKGGGGSLSPGLWAVKEQESCTFRAALYRIAKLMPRKRAKEEFSVGIRKANPPPAVSQREQALVYTHKRLTLQPVMWKILS